MRNWLYYTWLSGDHLVEQAIHNVDTLIWIMRGQPGARRRHRRPPDAHEPDFGHIYDHFAIDYEFPNGVHSTMFCRQQDACDKKVANEFVGTEGPRLRPAAVLHHRREAVEARESVSINDAYVKEHTDLIASIRAGKPLNELKQVTESSLAGILGREAAYTGSASPGSRRSRRRACCRRSSNGGRCRCRRCRCRARRSERGGAAIAALAHVSQRRRSGRAVLADRAGASAARRSASSTSEPHMGTLVRIALYAPLAAGRGGGRARAAFDRIAALDRTLSDYRPEASWRRCARAGRRPIPSATTCSPCSSASDALPAHRRRLRRDRRPLTHLWRRARRLSDWPAAERVAEHAPPADSSPSGSTPRRTVTLAEAGHELDVGGLAKGYAADAALRVLERTALTRALVALGGDVVAGDPPPGRRLDGGRFRRSGARRSAPASPTSAPPSPPPATPNSG